MARARVFTAAGIFTAVGMFGAAYAASKSTILAFQGRIPGAPFTDRDAKEWARWALLDASDWAFLFSGWALSAALAAWHLRRLNRPALLTWSLAQGVCLGLLAILDWTDGAVLPLAVAPLVLAWGLRKLAAANPPISAGCGTSGGGR